MQLVVISGKGGTGKTTVAAAFAYLNEKSIKVDCDVDASNLHILLGGEDIEEENFIGAKMAHIDLDKCIKCGACEKVCRFGAIHDYVIEPLKCEGCAACTVVCSQEAIILEDEITGKTITTRTKQGILSRAEMVIGAEGSGKLVTQVRKNAMKHRKNDEMLILDGTPGIGCAVMASITGCDAALIVVEPTQSGLNDFERVLSLTKFFGVKTFVCINKYDINEEMTLKIESFCKEEDIDLLGKIPFDPMVKEAVNHLKPIVCYEESKASKEIIKIWNQINKI
ncbi:ATP-binding protein [Marinisporobacter balticus]|uniref:MinD superfamily P-loop ATPase n=1 Tax=Marinisporobacter balticus TaxID=2018667 RepID=A0A4R2KMY4_9FIRM|nr:ATP-binding protein [Marinisporobacter balticus]TCO74814.1 MinD superfamily P-loop ATPase [Marinisporobacter balticus]